MKHLRNHYNHSHCCSYFPPEQSVKCYCGERLYKKHSCTFLDSPVECVACFQDFKTIEACNNHCVTAHHSGSFGEWSEFVKVGYMMVMKCADFPPFYATRVNLIPQSNIPFVSQGMNLDLNEIEKIMCIKSMRIQTFKKKIVLQTFGINSKILEKISIRSKIILWDTQPNHKFLRTFYIELDSKIFSLVFNSRENHFHEIYHLFSHLICDKPKQREIVERTTVHFADDEVYVKRKEKSPHFISQMMTEEEEKFRMISEVESQSIFSVDHNVKFQLPDFLTSLPKTLKDLIPPEKTKVFMSLALKILMCYKSNWNFDTICLCLADMFITFGFDFNLSQSTLKLMLPSLLLLFGVFGPKKGYYSQSFSFADDNIIKAMITCATIFFATLFLKSTPQVTLINDLVSSTVKLGNFSRGITNSWKLFSDVVETCYGNVYESIFGVPLTLKEAEEYLDGIDQWYLDVQEHSQIENVEELATDVTKCNKISDIYNKGLVIQRQCAHYKLDNKVKQCVDLHFRIITKLYERVSRSGAFHQGPKIEPLIIQLFGESGVGKSGLMYLVAAEILKCDDVLSGGNGSVDGDTWTNKIYARNIENEFWVGYHNQMITLYDDFGQMRDSAAKPNLEFMEMIRFGNLASMCLHMASLEDKDKTFFKSKAVILTSNCKTYPIESLISKEAFHRRIDVSIEVQVKEKFRKTNSKQLDPVKAKQITGKTLSDEIYQFIIHIGEIQSEPKDFAFIKELIHSSYKNKIKRHNIIVGELKDYLEKPVIPSFVSQAGVDETFHDALPPSIECDYVQAGIDVPFAIALARKTPPLFGEKITISEALTIGRENYVIDLKDDFLQIMKNFRGYVGNIEVSTLMHYMRPYLTYLTLPTQKLFLKSSNLTFDQLIHIIEFGNVHDYCCSRNSIMNPGTCECRLVFFFAFDFGYGFNEGCRDALEQNLNTIDFALHAFEFFKKKDTSIKRVLLDTVGSVKEGSIAFIKRVGEVLTSNEYVLVTSIWALIQILIVFITYMFEPKDDEDYWNTQSSKVLTHHHEGLEIGQIALHYHKCEDCGITYSHSHKIKTFQESIKYGLHLCVECKKKVPTSQFQSGDNVTTNLPKHTVQVSEETEQITQFQSGDNVTTNLPKHTVQVSEETKQITQFQSGDNVTTNLPKQVTQFQSGDNVTTNLPKQVTQTKTEETDFVTEDVKINDFEYYQEYFKKELFSTQMSQDDNALSLGRKVYGNTYMISIRSINDGVYSNWRDIVQCVFVRGRCAISVAHFIATIKPTDVEMKIVSPFNTDGFVMPLKSIIFKKFYYPDGEPKDLMLIVFPSNVHDHPDILNSIADSENMSKFKTIPCMLITGTSIKDKQLFNQKFCEAVSSDVPLLYKDLDLKSEIDPISHPPRLHKVRHHYDYIMHTNSGDCGSLLVALSRFLPKKIIGMHICGRVETGEGASVALNADEIRKCMASLPAISQMIFDTSLIDGDDFANTPPGNFVPLSKLKVEVRSPSKTNLRKSLLYGKLWEPTSTPANLSRFLPTGEHTIEKGLLKCSPIPPFINEDYLLAAVKSTFLNFRTLDRKDLTFEEAITGDLFDDFSNPLNRSSSPGFPWILKRKGKGKTMWTGEEEYVMNEDLKKIVDERIEYASRGIRYPTFWIDTLKDERRPLEKKDKPRVFSAGSMDFIIAFRMFFLTFCSALARDRIDNEIGIGINVYSYDWTRLAKHLQRKGDKVVAGDYSNYDGSLVGQVLELIGEFIIKHYDQPQFETIRRTLWREVINSVHIYDNNVYLWTHSHPSGHPMTAILNSIFNSVICRVIFFICAEEANLNVTMSDFDKNVSMISYGDDNILNISDECISWFNQISMSQNFPKVGMTYTDEMKSETLVPYRSLNEVSFLKRKFLFNDELVHYVAPLDLKVCKEMCNWIRGEIDVTEACCVNVETACREIALHGRKIFDEIVPFIEKVCKQNLKMQPQILTYFEYIRVYQTSYGELIPNP